MLDVLNDRLLEAGERPVAFDHDCREGICGSCSLLIDDMPHGPRQVTSCQIYMRDFEDGQEITVEPFRATAFPVLRDLMVDRSPLDRIVESGGYVSVNAGPKPEPNSIPVHPEIQEAAMDAAICIGCGACVAACPNGSGMLFTGAKVTHLNLLAPGRSRALPPGPLDGPPARRRGIRRLHQHRRVPAGLPAEHLDQGHRRAQPRVPLGDDPQAPWPLRPDRGTVVPGYRLRPARLPADRKGMLDVLETANMHNIPSAEMDDFDVGHWYVAEDDSQIVGVAGFRILPTDAGPVGKTTLLAVHPAQRANGIGRSLQELRMDQMRDAGASRVITNADRPETIEWYQRHFGYRVVGELAKLHEFGLPDVDRWTTLEASLS